MGGGWYRDRHIPLETEISQTLQCRLMLYLKTLDVRTELPRALSNYTFGNARRNHT